MNLKISLASLNGHGVVSMLENDTGDSIDICYNTNRIDHKGVCKRSAEVLRRAAARFELLAKEAQPFQVTTHKRINAPKEHQAEIERQMAISAAAPDLLAVCQKLVEWDEKYPKGRTYSYHQRVEEQLEAIAELAASALAKAAPTEATQPA